uniref:Uncharacterized protein n=1 Tax=Crocodylus porosus TaxID=8502 RepID=A0A7M4E9R6_CROPO
MPPTGGSFPCCSCDSKDTSGGKAGTSQVPQDSLDFNLSSLYDHHKELLRNKNQVVIHKETRTSQGLPMRCWVSPTKESVHSIKGTIECPHNASTNSGYSRKDNGGFFSQ